jgi:outer membrane biogenesis lipoprotein LolB
MQVKPITAIVVLLLVVASLLVSGCTTQTDNTATNQTPITTTSTATHDAFLEKYLAAYKNTSYANKNTSIKAWEVTWINSTSARLEWTVFGNSTNGTYNYQETYLVFPTT